jgi:isopenicillin-N epimerase
MPKLRDFWMLDPKVRYLNHGAFGATPRAVLEHQAELRARMERESSRFFLHYVGPERARHALGQFISADADDLVFVTNATTGVNLVLQNLELEPGDEIVTTNHDYLSCRMALQAHAERQDQRLIVADVPLPLRDSDTVI